MITSPAYTAPTAIVDGSSNFIEGADVNGLFTQSGGPNDFANGIAGIATRTISGNATLTQNVDCIVNVSAGSNITVTLPAATGQKFGIWIKKIDQTYNTITIQCAGSDKIEDPNNPLTSPTATSLVLRNPDAGFLIFPVGTIWRIWSRQFTNRVSCRAYNTNTAIPYGGAFPGSTIIFDTVVYDYTNGYNNATGVFTAKIPGKYMVTGCLFVLAGSATANECYIFKNSANDSSGQNTLSQTISAAHKLTFFGMVDLALGETIKINFSTGSATTRAMASSPADSYVNIQLINPNF
jgi:hypothetical protein